MALGGCDLKVATDDVVSYSRYRIQRRLLVMLLSMKVIETKTFMKALDKLLGKTFGEG